MENEEKKTLIEQALSGNAVSQIILSMKTGLGDGMEKNVLESKRWCEQSLIRGNLLAKAWYIFNGWDQDETKAEEAFFYALQFISLNLEEKRGEEMGYALLLCGCLSEVKRDMEKAKDYFQLSSLRGNVLATFQLACMYYNGIGTKQNWEKAFELFSFVAQKGNVVALRFLGVMYELGQFVEVDVNKSVELYTLASENGENSAKFMLANLYYSGVGVRKDIQKAMQLYFEASNEGHELAIQKLLEITDQKEFQGMMDFLEKSASKGVYFSIKKLLELYDSEFCFHPKKTEKVISLYEQLASLGFTEGFVGLGKKFMELMELEISFQYFQEASNKKNDREAKCYLSFFFREGIVVQKNYKKACQLLMESALDGFLPSAIQLLKIYRTGKVVPFFKKLAGIFKTESQKGSPLALYHLATMLEKGEGVPLNLETSLRYFHLSFSKGFLPSKRKVRELISTKKLNWKPEYHVFFKTHPPRQNNFQRNEKKSFSLNDQIVSILLCFRNRSLSSKKFSFLDNNSICLIVRFLVHFCQCKDHFVNFSIHFD